MNDPIRDVVQEIVEDAEEPLTYEELEEKVHGRIQRALRVLSASGKIETTTEERTTARKVYKET